MNYGPITGHNPSVVKILFKTGAQKGIKTYVLHSKINNLTDICHIYIKIQLRKFMKILNKY